MTEREISGYYEAETGAVIIETIYKSKYEASQMPGVIVANHGPFTWGATPMDAVHNAKVLEEVAKMAYRTEKLNQNVQTVDQALLD